MTPNIVHSYRQASVMTADPMKLVLMCYEGAISNLKSAKNAYLAKDYESKGKYLQKTIDFISELNASLDMDRGEGIAVNLRALYLYFIRLLTEADLKRDLKVFDEVLNMLLELDSAWKTIDEERKQVANTASKPGGMVYGRPAAATSEARVWSI